MSDDLEKRLTRIETELQRLTQAIERLASGAVGGDRVATPEPDAPPQATAAVSTPPEAAAPIVTYGELLTGLFEAALATQPEQCWERLEGLTHSEDLQAPRAIDHLRAFNWKRFRATAESYLRDGKASTWVVARTVPASLSDDATTVKVFLERRGANPAPVSLAREGGTQGPWRVRNLSL